MPKDFDNTGTVSIWERNAKGNGPIMSGRAYAHRDIKAGEEFDIALWRGKSQHPKAPTYTGKVSDPFKPEGGSGGGQRQSGGRQYEDNGGGDFDDDIPFNVFAKGEWA